MKLSIKITNKYMNVELCLSFSIRHTFFKCEIQYCLSQPKDLSICHCKYVSQTIYYLQRDKHL